MMERFFDVVFSLLALIIFLPLLLTVACILKFTGEGEVFFFQERVGKSGKLFKLFKFATMVKDSPGIGTGTVTMKDDARILPVGKILRKTKVNELPQLFNILLGQMSLIGPRPLTPETYSSYSSKVQGVISEVRPGLSGIGSIVFRGEEEIMYGESASIGFYNESIAPFKGSLEEWFVSNKGLYVYFIAIFLTVWVIFFPKTTAPWIILKDLPEPPDRLKFQLNFKHR